MRKWPRHWRFSWCRRTWTGGAVVLLKLWFSFQWPHHLCECFLEHSWTVDLNKERLPLFQDSSPVPYEVTQVITWYWCVEFMEFYVLLQQSRWGLSYADTVEQTAPVGSDGEMRRRNRLNLRMEVGGGDSNIIGLKLLLDPCTMMFTSPRSVYRWMFPVLHTTLWSTPA